MTYNKCVSCARCNKILAEGKTRHFCETINEFSKALKFFSGYNRAKSSGFWVD